MDPETSLRISDDELLFFRLTCDLFPCRESPLPAKADPHSQALDPSITFQGLSERGLLRTDGSGAHEKLLRRMTPVAECEARVAVSLWQDAHESLRRTFYLAEGMAVEYQRAGDTHLFGEPCPEKDLVAALCHDFLVAQTPRTPELRLDPGEYLVFAVFARDVRAKPDSAAADAHMSIAEVLAYFDEPEAPQVRTPCDEDWEKSVSSLVKRGILLDGNRGHVLHQAYHAVAREISADRHYTIARFDFFDEQWLVREINLYPANGSVFQISFDPDGSACIVELSPGLLREALKRVVRTLPNVLNPSMTHSPVLRGEACRRS